ncbi:MAG: hypothetical protein Q8M94_12210 [Ignavibacteria bacterium]|nr:hypothetical protein [Ignavibacteria bacterium]
MNYWEQDKKFADKYLPQITAILKDNAKHIVSIIIAPYEDDTLRATDYIIKVESGTVAVRLRRDSYYRKYRDWTIRSRRASGMETELIKLKKGFASWYLYGWTVQEDITAWMLIDLAKVRSKTILDMKWNEKDNHDGTHFIYIPAKFLKEQDCIIASNDIELKIINNQMMSPHIIKR